MSPKMNSGFFSSTRSDYETPQPLFDKLDAIFGFNLDVCANERNAKVRNNYITKKEDGLSQHWSDWAPEGHIVRAWMNPEYGSAVPWWTDKAAEEATHGVSTVALLAARTDAGWFHEDVSRANFIIFLRGRIKFLLPCTICGRATASRRRPSMTMVVALEQDGSLPSDAGDLYERGTLPVCDSCNAKDVTRWHKKSSNSPAMGSILVGWGFMGRHLAVLPPLVKPLGVVVRPGAWV